MLVVGATVKDFDKLWTIIIDSGASGNYVRRSSLIGSQLYAEALQAQGSDTITFHLATRKRVTVARVFVNLNVKCMGFDGVELCLVLILNTRYDLFLGMAWMVTPCAMVYVEV